MDRSTLIADVIQLIANEAAVPSQMIQLDTHFHRDLNLNADQLTHLGTRIQAAFGLRTEPYEIPSLQTVDDIVRYVEKQIPAT